MSLTRKLRQQHAEILLLARRTTELARSTAPERRAEDLRTALDRLATVLLHHLSLEDDQLYPKLRRSPNPLVASTAERFESEMGGLASAYKAFDQRWRTAANIAASPAEFRGEFDYVVEALRHRILAEENLLYMLSDSGQARAG